MKKIIFTFMSLLFFASISNAQVYVNRPSNKEVSSKTYDYRLDATSFEVQWVGDGNNVRGAFNIGSGVSVGSLATNVPSFVKDFRFVPFVTVDSSSAGVAPRATFAVLAPQLNFSPHVGVQFGAALRGLDARNDWRPVNGVDPYVRLSVYFK